MLEQGARLDLKATYKIFPKKGSQKVALTPKELAEKLGYSEIVNLLNQEEKKRARVDISQSRLFATSKYGEKPQGPSRQEPIVGGP